MKKREWDGEGKGKGVGNGEDKEFPQTKRKTQVIRYDKTKIRLVEAMFVRRGLKLKKKDMKEKQTCQGEKNR